MIKKWISVLKQKITNDHCVINYHNVIHSIVLFQLNEATDNKGRYLNDLWQEDFYFYENCHDYIQWMFPLAEESEYNLDAPVLTEEDIIFFQNNIIVQSNIKKSFRTILSFYGFEIYAEGIRKNESFERRKKIWLTRNNHNQLRLTRIMKCLCLLGMPEYTDALLTILLEIAKESDVSSYTLEKWKGLNQKEGEVENDK